MLLWYGASAVAAIAIAWVAALIHESGHAPIGLVSILIGVALGAALAGIAATQQLRATRQLMIGSIVLAILTVLAEHAWLYVDFRRQWIESRTNAQVAIFRRESPPTPSEYFSHELTPQSATLWCVDALLIVASTIATVYLVHRSSTPGARDEPGGQSSP